MNKIIFYLFIFLSLIVGSILVLSTILAFIFDRFTKYLHELRNCCLRHAYPLE